MIKHFERNTRGVDYVVGDIHGMFTLLQTELDKLGFDEVNDRLFSVGDLVDRGPESEQFGDWLRKPWFHAVRGNHERLVIDSVEKGETTNASAIHAMNGGMWLYGLPEVEQQCYAIEMSELPLAIEVETEAGLVGIIHAECPQGDWDKFKQSYLEPEDEWEPIEAVAIWARTKINKMDTQKVKGLHRLYVGHTPVNKITVLGNVYYIDTGACFKGGKLSILRIN